MNYKIYVANNDKTTTNRGGSRNCKTGGRDPGAEQLLGSGDCFVAPSHIMYRILSS